MKAVILDSSHATDKTGERIGKILVSEFQSHGLETEHIIIREQKIGNCAGDFFCWVRSPGICHVDDDNRRIAKTIVNSDLVVYMTPVTFGGYSSMLKRVIDHTIQNISPYFAKVEGETHHKKRYSKYPDLLVIGWMDSPDAESERVFKHLVKRNAVNFYAEKAVAGIIMAGQSDLEIRSLLQVLINNLNRKKELPIVELPVNAAIPVQSDDIKRAVLLVGSPKTHKSNSNSLGSYLFEQMRSHSVETETIYLHTTVRSPEKMNALFQAVDNSDLITLAFPLYEDTLPSPVIEVLERVAAHRRANEVSHRPLFTAIANCGFPEAQHNANAIAVCEAFARQAKLHWAGGLAMGGGEQIGGRPLAEIGGQTIRLRKALDMAAVALVQGRNIPKAAQELMSKPVIPAIAYRLMGEFIWKQRAKPYGAGKLLKLQPYLVKA